MLLNEASRAGEVAQHMSIPLSSFLRTVVPGHRTSTPSECCSSPRPRRFLTCSTEHTSPSQRFDDRHALNPRIAMLHLGATSQLSRVALHSISCDPSTLFRVFVASIGDMTGAHSIAVGRVGENECGVPRAFRVARSHDLAAPCWRRRSHSAGSVSHLKGLKRWEEVLFCAAAMSWLWFC